MSPGRALTPTFAERAVELAAEAGRRAGVDPRGATILRVAAAVTVELPRAAVVARIEPPGNVEAARRQTIVARILEQRGISATRLIAPDRQPLVLTDGVVTLWRRLRLLPGAPDPETLGRVARRLHTACGEDLPAETPVLDPFHPIPGWLERSSSLPPLPATERLWQRLELLRDRWHDTLADDPLGTVLVHGDFHADNVVLTDKGPVLLDLEMAGRGPACWDLLPQWLAMRRYGGVPEDYRRFCAAYGAALPTSPVVELLQQAYELNLVCWAVGHRDTSPAMAEQATVRLATFLGRSDEPWTLL